MYPISFAVVTLILAGLRLSGFKSKAFQAVAHLWVGAFMGAFAIGHNPWFLVAVLVLSGVELMRFSHDRLSGPAQTIGIFAGLSVTNITIGVSIGRLLVSEHSRRLLGRW